VGRPNDALPGSSSAATSDDGAKGTFAHLYPTYEPAEVAADRLIHIVGVCLGTVGSIAVVVLAARTTGTLGLVATSLYAASLLAMLGLSAAYNLSRPSRLREILRRLDHATIYILIAGTHSAITLGRIDNAASRWLAVVAWGIAVTGAAIKIVFPRRFERAAVASYVALGAIVFLSLVPLADALRPGVLPLVGVGAVLYASGVIFHLWDGLRFQNAIWHAMVFCAACFHYAAIVLNM
jgi:hemolysin III